MTAIISDCGTYRYRLYREPPQLFGVPSKRLLWIMLNPSTADARLDDPTIRKCRGFGERLGFTRFAVGNLFAYRATDPKELHRAAIRGLGYVIGPDNDGHLAEMIAEADAVLFAWGSHGAKFVSRVSDVIAMVPPEKAGRIGALSKEHQPRHPLMLSYDTPVFWKDRSA